MKRNLAVVSLEGYEPEIGRWLWALEDVRRVLKKALEGVTQAELDFQPAGSNGVGTLLYHIALVEADWLFVEVMQAPLPESLRAWFPYEARTTSELLTPVTGKSIEHHIARLDVVRAVLLAHFRGMDLADRAMQKRAASRRSRPAALLFGCVYCV